MKMSNWKACYLKPKKLLDYDISVALHGLIKIGYTPQEIDSLENCERPCLENIYVGCLNSTRYLFKKFGIRFPVVPDYPTELDEWFGRNVECDTWQGVNNRKKCEKFVKPKVKGQFQPFVGEFPNYQIEYLHIPEECPIWVSDPIEIMSEYRVFVNQGIPLDVRKYKGSYFYYQVFYIPEILSSFNNGGKPFILDMAIIKKEDSTLEAIVLECNPGICFGSYGLDPNLYAEMIHDTYKNL